MTSSSWLAETARRSTVRTARVGAVLYDLTTPAVLGVDVALLASGRLDNQVSCWAAIDVTGRARARRRRGVDDRALRPRGGRESTSTTGAGGPLLEHVLERLVIAAWRHPRRPPPGAGGVDVRVGRQRPRRPPELPRASRPGPPAARQRRPGDQGEHQPALRDDRPSRQAVFERACTAAGVPWQVFVSPQQHAVRLDDRADHRDSARHRHRRRRRAAALDALGTGAVRRPRSGVVGVGARRLLRSAPTT